MEVTFVWSWFSFWIGVASVFIASFALLIVLGITNALNQGKKKKEQMDSMEKMFAAWGGRDNSGKF